METSIKVIFDLLAISIDTLGLAFSVFLALVFPICLTWLIVYLRKTSKTVKLLSLAAASIVSLLVASMLWITAITLGAWG